jgi:hypothetical protein
MPNSLIRHLKIHEARAFNFTYRYIDDVSSINNSRFAEFLPLIYPPELEVKETTDTASSASFLNLYLEFDDRGQQFVPIGMPTTGLNSVPPKETNMLSMRNSSILITCSSE